MRKQEERDLQDFQAILEWLRENGKEYQEEDTLVNALGRERFEYCTRNKIKEATFILQDYPGWKKYITEELKKYFEELFYDVQYI